MRIDAILYINLDRRTDRQQNMINLLTSYNVVSIARRVPGVDGSKLTPQTISKRDVTDQGIRDAFDDNAPVYMPLTRGGVGCALSHKRCYEYIVANEIGACLIFEDDIRLSNDFVAKLSALQPPDDYEVLFLGYHAIHTRGVNKLKRRFVKPHKAYGLFGYVVTLSGAKKLVQYVFPITQQIDSEIPKHFDKINAYAVRSDLVLVYSDPSALTTQFGTDIQHRLDSKLQTTLTNAQIVLISSIIILSIVITSMEMNKQKTR